MTAEMAFFQRNDRAEAELLLLHHHRFFFERSKATEAPLVPSEYNERRRWAASDDPDAENKEFRSARRYPVSAHFAPDESEACERRKNFCGVHIFPPKQGPRAHH